MTMQIPEWIKDKGRKKPYLNPISVKLSSQKKFNEKAKQDFFGQAPNIFVGRFGYPNINVGILSTEEYNQHDNIPLWSKEKYSIPKIIDLRTNLINSSFKAQIKGSRDKWTELSQEIAMASNPADVEISLSKKPNFLLSAHQTETPHGPNVQLKKATLTENPKIPTKVDKIVSDTDYKAAPAIAELSEKGFDEHYLTRLLTAGTLGVKMQRKLVPTRWGITAVDDTIGKRLTNEIHNYNHLEDYCAYFGNHLGNYYLFLFFPEAWSYELFEMIIQEGTSFSTDHESYKGRKYYAHNTAGGYYTVRLAALEKLKQLKKQASVLALRFIDATEYIAPLGVWVTREASRNAASNQPIKFSSKELMLEYARKLAKKKFNMDIDHILKQSILLKEINQPKLLSFF